MVRVSGRKALEGMKVSLEDAWEGSLGRLGMRRSLLPRLAEVIGKRTGLAVFLAVISALAVLAVLAANLYRRKRRQVTEHYKMGGAESVEESESASSFVPAAPPGL